MRDRLIPLEDGKVTADVADPDMLEALADEMNELADEMGRSAMELSQAADEIQCIADEWRGDEEDEA